MVMVYVRVLVSWMVVVRTVVESPIDVVRTTVLSKTEVDTPVRVSVAGVDDTLTFRPPDGRASTVLLWLRDHSDQVRLALDVDDFVSPDTSVLLDGVRDQSDQVVF